MATKADYTEAVAILTLFGNDIEGRKRLYYALPAPEQRIIKRRMGGMARGARIMRHFSQGGYAWEEAMAEVVMMRRLCDESSRCSDTVEGVGSQ